MLSDKERKLLEGKNFVYIATINADGSPQVSPVWVDLEGDIIRINSERTRLKVRNMKRDPRIALSVHDQDNPYDHISLRGDVIELTEEGARDHIDALSRKYLGKSYPWHQETDHRVIARIRKHVPENRNG
jgi:PPOX class probable F420-dependent enzyme